MFVVVFLVIYVIAMGVTAIANGGMEK